MPGSCSTLSKAWTIPSRQFPMIGRFEEQGKREMIIGKLFEGDREDLAEMQHDVYGESLGVIMEAAFSRLRAAQRVLNEEMELLDRINQKSFDGRCQKYCVKK